MHKEIQDAKNDEKEKENSVIKRKENPVIERKENSVTEENENWVNEGKENSVKEGRDSVNERKEISLNEQKENSVNVQKENSVNVRKNNPENEQNKNSENKEKRPAVKKEKDEIVPEEDVPIKGNEVIQVVLDVQQIPLPGCEIGSSCQLPENDEENDLDDKFKEIKVYRKVRPKQPPDKMKTWNLPLIKKHSFLTLFVGRMSNNILNCLRPFVSPHFRFPQRSQHVT